MFLLTIGFVIIFLIIRVVYLITLKNKEKFFKDNSKTLIVIGSGGHTTEMIKQLKMLNPKLYHPRLYVMADVDTSSEHKILELEKQNLGISKTDYDIVKIPRSRTVNQSYFTSIFSTLYSTVKSIPVVAKFKPDLILCNGPGTCIPICLIAFFFNAIFYLRTRIVFIESICRVKTLSLSGKILLYFADLVIVQWAQLHQKYPSTVFLGRLA